jgi:hypothetical protein
MSSDVMGDFHEPQRAARGAFPVVCDMAESF